MSLLSPASEPVPLSDVAEILALAISRLGGGPAGAVLATGYQLAAALDVAGFRVVRDAATGPQLTL